MKTIKINPKNEIGKQAINRHYIESKKVIRKTFAIFAMLGYTQAIEKDGSYRLNIKNPIVEKMSMEEPILEEIKKVLSLNGAEENKDYEIVITNE